MRKLIVTIPLTLLLILTIAHLSYAADLSGRFSIGVGNPYLALRYGFTPKVSGEIRAAFGQGITVYGLRGYYHFTPQGASALFMGVEGDVVTFDKVDATGTGTVLAAFVGLEYALNSTMTFMFVIGPAFISVSSEEASSAGMQYVYNLGINFYFP